MVTTYDRKENDETNNINRYNNVTLIILKILLLLILITAYNPRGPGRLEPRRGMLNIWIALYL